MKNWILNIVSRIVGRYFSMVHLSSWASAAHKERALNAYVSLRRRLPVMECGKHWGNHDRSRKLPFHATQGG
jgi:hypothetical protein